MQPRADERLALLRGLVEIPSVSGAEGEAASFLVRWMASHGFRARVDEVGNAVGVLEPPGDDAAVREIVLLGHIDTVGGAPLVHLTDGRLYGRGAVDAKGPLAAFTAAAALAGPVPGWRVVVVGAVEEETATSRGARHIAAARRPDLAVIGEPSGWQRATLGYKGRLLAEVVVKQALSHCSGGAASACEVAVGCWNSVTAGLRELNQGREKAWDQVIATLRGFWSEDDGLHEQARLSLGFRLPPDAPPGRMREIIAGLVAPAQVTFHGDEQAYRAERDSTLGRAFLRSIREQGGRPTFVLKTGTSDMNVVGPAWNCPILAYGPGDSNLDHTPEEHVELAEWERGVAVLAGVLRGLPAA